MTLNETHESLAFGPGSDLWIVPERKNSELVQKLDWYLNFQIAQSAHHQSLQISPTLQNILKECGLKTYHPEQEERDCMMILSSALFPNRWVLVVRGSDDLASWTEKAIDKWKKMNKPSVRVFLPQEVSAAQFEKLWKKSGGSENITVVAEHDEGFHG
jgi:hypothetical protein